MLKVTSSGCFEGELVKVLQSENPPKISTQTSNDSPTAIYPFGNTISCPLENIGSAVCSSSGLSSPSHCSYVSDEYTNALTFICSLPTYLNAIIVKS
jgi:hypothetical protein